MNSLNLWAEFCEDGFIFQESVHIIHQIFKRDHKPLKAENDTR